MLRPGTHSSSRLRAALAFGLLCGLAAAAGAPEPAPELVVAGRPALVLGFDRLASFPYVIADAGTGAKGAEIAARGDQIPPAIHAYHGRRVVLTGYMMPVRLEGDRVRAFVMMKDTTTCCYGATPNMNDYVIVTMTGAPVANVADVPVRVVGVLRVGEKREDGYLVSLFELDGEQFLGTSG